MREILSELATYWEESNFIDTFLKERRMDRKKVTGRRGRRCRQVPDDRKENRRYCKLKENYYISLYGELALESAVVCLKTDC
jgi:hypothetical protein